MPWRLVGEVAGRLVAPGAVERVLANRHELKVRVAHFVAVIHQHVGQFAVSEVPPSIGRPLPRGKMHLVNREGLFEPIGLGTLPHPAAVLPGKVGQLEHDGSRLRRQLGVEGERVGLFDRAAVRRAEHILVHFAVADARNETRPNPGVAAMKHVAARFPAVGIRDDRNLSRIGRPDGKTRSRGTVDHVRMCPKCAIHRAANVPLHRRREIAAARSGVPRPNSPQPDAAVQSRPS